MIELPPEKFRECQHRGDFLRLEDCKPCQTSGKPPEVYACETHGECTLYTIGKRKSDGTRWKSCSTCEDFRE